MGCMDTAAETTLPGAELHVSAAAILNPSEGSKDPAAVPEKEIEEPKISSAPYRSGIGWVEMIQKLRFQDSVHCVFKIG